MWNRVRTVELSLFRKCEVEVKVSQPGTLHSPQTASCHLRPDETLPSSDFATSPFSSCSPQSIRDARKSHGLCKDCLSDRISDSPSVQVDLIQRKFQQHQA